MINSSSKTDVRLKMVYSFAAQTFVPLAAELVQLFKLPGEGQYDPPEPLTSVHIWGFTVKQ